MNNEKKDRLAAEVVMGWVKHWEIGGWTGEKRYYWLTQEGKRIYNWHPTTSIEQAMMVAEKMADHGFPYFELYRYPDGDSYSYWAQFGKDEDFAVIAFSENPADAIVTAALQAVQGGIK